MSTDKTDTDSELVEEYLRGLKWSNIAKDYEKNLVAGNIRAFAAWFRARLKAPAAQDYPFAKADEELPQLWPEAFRTRWRYLQSNAPALQTTSHAAAFWFDAGSLETPTALEPVRWRVKQSDGSTLDCFATQAEAEGLAVPKHGETVEALYAAPHPEPAQDAAIASPDLPDINMPVGEAINYWRAAARQNWNSVNRLLAEQDAAIAMLREARSAMEPLTKKQILWMGSPLDLADRIDAFLANKEPKP